MDKVAHAFGAFLGRVDAILDSRGYAMESQDVAFGDWRFDWFEAFVAGIQPYEAVEDALIEMRDRGLLTGRACQEMTPEEIGAAVARGAGMTFDAVDDMEF